MKYSDLFQSYLWLVHLLSIKGKISFSELNKQWQRAAMSGGLPLPRSTFNRHRKQIEEMFGIVVDCDRKDDYQYYIYNPEVLKAETFYHYLFTTFSFSSFPVFSGVARGKIRPQAMPISSRNLSCILQALSNQLELKLKYAQTIYLIQPYYLAQRSSNWYLVGALPSLPTSCKGFVFFKLEEVYVQSHHFELSFHDAQLLEQQTEFVEV